MGSCWPKGETKQDSNTSSSACQAGGWVGWGGGLGGLGGVGANFNQTPHETGLSNNCMVTMISNTTKKLS